MSISLSQNNLSSPVGSIIAYAGKITQQIEAFGWLVCDGRLLRIASYPELYNAIGQEYAQKQDLEKDADSSVNGNSTFRIPDLKSSFMKLENDKYSNTSLPCIIKFTYR